MDYFSRQTAGTRDGGASPGAATPSQGVAPPQLYPTATNAEFPRPRPAIRLRRPPSLLAFPRTVSQQTDGQADEPKTSEEGQAASGGRRRSSSEPQRPSQPSYDLARQLTGRSIAPRGEQLTTVTEEQSSDSHPSTQTPHLQVPSQAFDSSKPPRNANAVPPSSTVDFASERPGFLTRVSTAATQRMPWNQDDSSTHRDNQAQEAQAHYEQDVVDFLDVVDPEVSTLTTLNNYQNSFVLPPPIGRFFSRAPAYDLSRIPTSGTAATAETVREDRDELERRDTALQQKATIHEEEDEEERESHDGRPDRPQLTHLSSKLSSASGGPERPYAVLPHGVSLEGWTEDEKEELNDYVRHLLHSRKAKFRRKMKGFGKYVRTPTGAFVTIYSFLLTFWGAAWVLFLIGWLHAGNRQAYFIEICDQILTALFALVGLGLAPFRIVDTYHMIYIAKYHYRTWELRKKRALPKLKDPNQLPQQPMTERPGVDIEDDPGKLNEESVLTPEQLKKFLHHQKQFSRSHTFYKSHETYTHYAFPLKLLIAIVCLFDCHSLFQMALGGTTWGINYHHRPKALTAVILAFSISCNIAGGITISVGDHMTRKKLIIEQMYRQSVTQEAMKRLGKPDETTPVYKVGSDKKDPKTKMSKMEKRLYNKRHSSEKSRILEKDPEQTQQEKQSKGEEQKK